MKILLPAMFELNARQLKALVAIKRQEYCVQSSDADKLVDLGLIRYNDRRGYYVTRRGFLIARNYVDYTGPKPQRTIDLTQDASCLPLKIRR